MLLRLLFEKAIHISALIVKERTDQVPQGIGKMPLDNGMANSQVNTTYNDPPLISCVKTRNDRE